jgi:hypothetical protein
MREGGLSCCAAPAVGTRQRRCVRGWVGGPPAEVRRRNGATGRTAVRILAPQRARKVQTWMDDALNPSHIGIAMPRTPPTTTPRRGSSQTRGRARRRPCLRRCVSVCASRIQGSSSSSSSTYAGAQAALRRKGASRRQQQQERRHRQQQRACSGRPPASTGTLNSAKKSRWEGFRASHCEAFVYLEDGSARAWLCVGLPLHE